MTALQINERIARAVGPSRIDIAYERRGARSDPTVLLIMGLGAQLVHWRPAFLDALVARQLHVIRFDNRDAGRSTHLHGGREPDLAAALAGDLSSAGYTLSDMAGDAIGLLDALGISSAHLVGVSMGAAIAQVAAIEHPRRVRSLTSMMSGTGDPSVGQMDPRVRKPLFADAPATSREEAVDQAIRRASIANSPGFPRTVAEIASVAGIAWDRDHDLPSILRQAVATVATGDRTEKLRRLDLPTLVVHGADDSICDVSGARATAAAIAGAELMLIDGMGHELPSPLSARIADRIAAVVRRGEARREASDDVDAAHHIRFDGGRA